RVLRVGRLVHLGPGETDFLGLAPRGVLAQIETRVVEVADFAIAIELDLRSADPVEAAAQCDLALRPDLVLGNVVLEPFGEHRLAPRSQFEMAGRVDPLLARSFESIRAQENRAALL